MNSSDNVILAYVEGCDLSDIAEPLEADFSSFVSGRDWQSKDVCVVNQIIENAPDDPPEYLPQWDLGLNFSIPNRSETDQKWMDDVHATVDFLSCQTVKYHRNFVIAVHNISRGFNEDVAYITKSVPDLKMICGMIEAHRT